MLFQRHMQQVTVRSTSLLLTPHPTAPSPKLHERSQTNMNTDSPTWFCFFVEFVKGRDVASADFTGSATRSWEIIINQCPFKEHLCGEWDASKKHQEHFWPWLAEVSRLEVYNAIDLVLVKNHHSPSNVPSRII